MRAGGDVQRAVCKQLGWSKQCQTLLGPYTCDDFVLRTALSATAGFMLLWVLSRLFRCAPVHNIPRYFPPN